MLLILLILLILLVAFNARGAIHPRSDIIWVIIVVLLIFWLLGAFNVVGDYGYWRRNL